MRSFADRTRRWFGVIASYRVPRTPVMCAAGDSEESVYYTRENLKRGVRPYSS
jgi:hypothetical protein